MKRTAIQRKPAKPRKRPAQPCSWSTRCKRRAPVVIDEDTRYCKTHAMLTADRYVGLAVKERDDWTCQACSASAHTDTIQWAHVISRGARFIRYELDNSMALCSACHYRFTLKPASWSVFLAETRPGLHDRLALLEAQRQRQGASVDIAEIIREYRELAVKA